MSKIDLSKAKIGDKFRTKNGKIVEYVGTDQNHIGDVFILENKYGSRYHFYKCGNYMSIEEHFLDLIEQVFDEPLDTKERDIRKNDEMRKVVEIEDEEKQELQRRQEVVEVANELFTRGTMDDWYCALIKHGKTKKTYLEWIFGWAEEFVSTREKYLKEGKL